MAAAIVDPTPPEHAPDAQDARERLLRAGLRLFAQQGFAKTSTRELAEAAAVNVAAIRYYFGDKAGLYRAVFIEPLGSDPGAEAAAIADPALPLTAALRLFFAGFLEPLKRGHEVQLCMKLHFRELLEPTGLWQQAVAHGIAPVHVALLQVLQRWLGLAAADDGVQRLALSLAGLGVHLHVAHDINEQLAPGLLRDAAEVDLWADHLLRYGLAMVAAEAARRGRPLPDPAQPLRADEDPR